jgi:pimeloyl-ACP methyl ester carboxylesterase
VQRRWLRRFMGGLSVPRFLWLTATAPGASVLDLRNIFRGMAFSMRTLMREIGPIDLEVAVPRLEMPVWFLSGRRDRQVDARVAEAYFDKLIAPAGKELVWFETAGHFVPFEEPDAFNATMARIAQTLTRCPARSP